MPIVSHRWPQPLLALAFGTLLVAGWLNPTHYLPWSAFYSELPVAVAAIVLAAAALGSRRTALVSMPTSAWVCLVLVVVPLLQFLSGKLVFAGDLLLAVVYLTGIAVCLFVGASAGSESDKGGLIDCIAWSILCGSLASTAIALQQWFGQADWSEWVVQGLPGARADSNLRQANHFATLVMWGMLAAVYLRSHRHVGGVTLGAVLTFLALGLALSQSRTAWVAWLVMAAWAVFRSENLWRPLGLRFQWVVALLLVYVLFLWAVFTLPSHLGLEWGVEAQQRLQVGGRPLIWTQMIEAIRQSPWAGYGWLQGQSAQADAALAKPGLEFTTYSHNVLLDLLVWNGVPLGVLLSGVLIAWYVRMGRQANGAADAFRFAALTVFAVHSMLEYPFAYTYFLVPVLLLAGQLERRAAPAQPHSRRSGLGRGVAIACTVMCGTATFAIARDYVLVEADRREVQMVLSRVGGERPFPSPPDLWVLDQLGAANRAARLVVRQGMPEAELEALLRAARRYPGVYLLRVSAAALAVNGRGSEALLQLKTLRGLHGEVQYQASVAWLSEQAQSQHWPVGSVLNQVSASQ
jgi:O-antigen ligase